MGGSLGSLGQNLLGDLASSVLPGVISGLAGGLGDLGSGLGDLGGGLDPTALDSGLDTTALGNGLSNGLDLTPTGSVIGTAPDGTPIDNAVLAQGDRAGVDLVAQDGTSGRYFVDLTQEEDFGGHTLEKHVGKSDDYLLYRMNTEVYDYGIFETPLNFASTFPSLGAANKLVNSTLSQNSTFVDDVAAGNYGNNPVEVISHFDSPTGRQAFRTSDNSQPRLRDVFGVLVVIKYDPSVPKGFYIKTAYPTNY